MARFNLSFWLMLTGKNSAVLFAALAFFVQTDFAGTDKQNFNQPEKSAVKKMNEIKSVSDKRPKFYRILDKILPGRGLNKDDICNENDAVQLRILNEYGAVFIVHRGVEPPPVCMFTDSEGVNGFQQGIFKAAAEIEGTHIELQTIAMRELLKARQKAQEKGLSITPRGGSEAARRSYADTLRLWKSRFEPACEYWKNQGKLTEEQINHLKSLPIEEQVGEVLELEKKGIFFNTFFDNSILYSVAAPGTSQHLSMLALDVKEFNDPEVRKILAKYGWFRTVRNDQPHFTFLGHEEKKLKKMGLKEIETKDGEFWIPDV